MSRLRGGVSIFIIIVAAVGLLLCGCGAKGKIALGPKPATYGKPGHEFETAMIDEGRAWVQSLSADAARRLAATGTISFTMESLKRSAPQRAAAVEKYAKDHRALWAGMVQAKGKGKAVQNIEQVTSAAPREVSLEQRPTGTFLVVRYTGTDFESRLKLAEAAPSR